MYGRKSTQLVKELACCEPGQLTAFNGKTIDEVLKECKEHYMKLETLLRRVEDGGQVDAQTTRKEDHLGAVILHLSLIRNKRCLMAYMYNRAAIVQSLWWKFRNLPQEISAKLNHSEQEYYKNRSSELNAYMSALDLDLTVDMVPPKDPYIQVRVLEDIGHIVSGDRRFTSLMRNSVHSLRRTDAEKYISQGLMEEFMG